MIEKYNFSKGKFVLIKKIIFLTFLIFPLLSYAGSEGMPWSFVLFQALNFSVFLFCLCYLLIKKLPPILKQKRRDFLDYRKRAISLEEQNRLECIKLEKEFSVLEGKAKNIQVTAQKAIDDLKREKQKEYNFWLENIKKQQEQEWIRQKRKKMASVKGWILSQVLQSTREKLQTWSKSLESHKIADQIVNKEWRTR